MAAAMGETWEAEEGHIVWSIQPPKRAFDLVDTWAPEDQNASRVEKSCSEHRQEVGLYLTK